MDAAGGHPLPAHGAGTAADRPAAARPVAGDGMLHPVVIGSIVLLALNDHVGKAAWPGAVTGKLSDAAGLVFFPALLVALWELSARAAGRFVRPRMAVTTWAVLLTGAVFALTKTVPWANDVYAVVLAGLQWPVRALVLAVHGQPPPALGRAVLVRDVSDLLALPCLVLPWALGRVRARLGEAL